MNLKVSLIPSLVKNSSRPRSSRQGALLLPSLVLAFALQKYLIRGLRLSY